MNWQDEFKWMYIAFGAGVLLSFLLIYFQRFPDTNYILLSAICCIGLYVLSILLRIQNHRGQLWLGRTIVAESKLKVVFPVVGFVVGIAVILL